MANVFGLNRTLGAAIAAIALVATLSSWIVLSTLKRLDKAIEARGHATSIIFETDAFLTAMLNQETGLRGYLVTGQKISLEPYDAGRPALDVAIRNIGALIEGDAGQVERLKAAEASARTWQTHIGEIAIREMDDPATRLQAVAIERTFDGKRHFDEFRAKLDAIKAVEELNRARQNAILAAAQRSATIVLLVGALITLLICAIIAIAINRLVVVPLKALAEVMRRLAQRDLDVIVPRTRRRSEVGAMARAVAVFKANLIELDRTSLLRVTADTIPAMVGYIDARRQVGFLNHEFSRWFDLQADDVSRVHGRPIAQAFVGDSFPGVGKELEAAFAGAEIRFEHNLVRLGVGKRDVEAYYRPHRAPDGTVIGVVTLLTDITDRKEAEMALSSARDAAEGANRAKSAFLANMSHELRTPLSAVIGYTELLEEDAADTGGEGMLPDLARIKSNAKHLLSLINDVLDLSKVEAKKMELFAEEIDVAAFVREASDTVGALAERKANKLVIDVDEGIGTMQTDAVKLRQCLFNLLSNAAKFTEGGTITLAVRRELVATGDFLTFAIRDTGIGMTPDQVDRLFQRFTQADSTTTRKFGGTGLGLALSQAFARLMGGDISVESVEGQGTTFALRLPAKLPEGSVEEDEGTTPEIAQAEGELVLVIDDEPSQRDLMSRFLQRQGFAVRTAADGKAGLDYARSMSPRVILLDVMMPGMDGWSVLQALKADTTTAGIPVVMVSFVADVNVSAALGAADAVAKPVDWTKLKGILDRFRASGGDVLVVDDDADMRCRLRTMLEKNGWGVREAGDGAEALEAVNETLPTLILLDLTMPVMDGFAFLHRLRQLPGCFHIPVVVLTARDVSASERMRLTEADSILKKGDTSMRDITAELRRLKI